MINLFAATMYHMKSIYYVILFVLAIQSCIGTDIVDDFVEAKVSIDNPITSLKKDNTYQFEATYLNNIGIPEPAIFQWNSSDESIVQIDNEGLAEAVGKGKAIITATANGISDMLSLIVSDTTIGSFNERVAELSTVSSYPLDGKVILRKTGGKIILEFDNSFNTTSALPGLYVYLTNNVSTINNALEVAKVAAFTGAQSYEIAEDISLTEYAFVLFYCKPFLVPVGNGELKP